MFGSTLLALVLGGLVCGVLGLVVVAIVVGLVVSMRRRSQVQARMIEAMSQAQAGAQAPAPAESPQVRDQRIPLRRFGQCAVFIITGDQDYGYFPAAAPQRMLSGSWGIADTAGARAQIEAMLKGPSGAGGVAFDQVRAIHLSRAAAGALRRGARRKRNGKRRVGGAGAPLGGRSLPRGGEGARKAKLAGAPRA